MHAPFFARLLASSMALFILVAPARADTIDAAARTSKFIIKSKILDEKREIYIRTPPAHDPTTALPVIFVTDGEWDFDLVAAHFDYMADNGVFPPVIVTGARNVNRNRDYLPKEDADYPDSGGADAYLEFVRTEWAPFVSEKHSTSEDRVLIGHSFGGVFALHALFAAPGFFDAHLALSPSSWIADNALSAEAQAMFGAHPDIEAFVYISVGEGDGGPTIPSSKALAALFETAAPPGIEWKFSITPQADHFKNFTMGLNEGLMLLFPAWEFAADVKRAGEERGAAGVNAWFDEKESALGYRFFPSWFDFGVAAIRLSASGGHDPAIALIERTRPYHSENPNFAAFAAQTYENAGDFSEALAEYERAIRIARRDKLDPNVIHIERLKSGVARIKAKMAQAGSSAEK